MPTQVSIHRCGIANRAGSRGRCQRRGTPRWPLESPWCRLTRERRDRRPRSRPRLEFRCSVGGVKPAVLTRDADGARRYVRCLAELGLFTVPAPVTCTAPAEASDRALLAAACRSGGCDWILVASARAVSPLI